MPDESLLTIVATSLKSTIFDLFHQNCEEMILFGSFARGDNEEGSDIDIMLLVDASREEIASKNWQIGDAAAELLLMYGVVVSPIVENREYFQKNLNYLPFFRNVDQEGVRLLA